MVLTSTVTNGVDLDWYQTSKQNNSKISTCQLTLHVPL